MIAHRIKNKIKQKCKTNNLKVRSGPVQGRTDRRADRQTEIAKSTCKQKMHAQTKHNCRNKYSVQTNQTEMSHKQIESPVRSSPGREGQTDGQTDKIKRVQRLYRSSGSPCVTFDMEITCVTDERHIVTHSPQAT